MQSLWKLLIPSLMQLGRECVYGRRSSDRGGESRCTEGMVFATKICAIPISNNNLLKGRLPVRWLNSKNVSIGFFLHCNKPR